MIGRTNAGTAGGGGGSCAVELHGGPGEVVTWSDGTNTGTVTLSSAGDGALALPAGGYTFSFSLGSVIAGAIAAILDPSITNVVNGWGNRTPAYWFGRTFGYEQTTSGSPTVTVETNDIKVSATGSTPHKYFYWGTLAKGTNTAAKIYCDVFGNFHSSWGNLRIYGSGITSTVPQASGQTGVFLEGAVSADTTIGVDIFPSGSTPTGCNIYAAYLE